MTATMHAPEGFTEVHGEPSNATTLDREALRSSVVARYEGVRRIQRKDNTVSLQHVFRLPAAHGGKRFAVWGTTRLDGKMRAVQPGTIVSLQYLGKVAVEGNANNEAHEWHVATTRAAAVSDRVLDAQKSVHAALSEAIDKAEAESRTRREAAQSSATAPDEGAPPHDDDDLPLF